MALLTHERDDDGDTSVQAHAGSLIVARALRLLTERAIKGYGGGGG